MQLPTTLTYEQVVELMKKLPAGEFVVPVSHEKPDDDEYLALRITELWGKDLFPGLYRMPIHTLDAGLRLANGQSGDSWLPKYLCIGLGGGIMDEHGKGDGKSAGSMSRGFLRVNDAALDPILAYSLRADDRAQDHPFNQASIIKNLHAHGVDREAIRKMYNRWFDSLYLRFRGSLIFDDRPKSSLQQIAVMWLAKGYTDRAKFWSVMKSGTFADAMEAAGLSAAQADEVREIQRFVDRDLSQGALTDFDLGGLVRAMQFTGVPDLDVIKDVNLILDAKAKVQRDFMSAQTHFREKASYLKDSPVPVAVIRSDNEQMSRAARTVNPRMAVLVQQRSTGHIRLFGDQRRCLRPILARLRALERRKHGLTDRMSWTQLTEGGTLVTVPEWYGFAKYGKVIHIFNSTIKAPRTRRTRLSLDDVVRCVRDGLAYANRSRGRKTAKPLPKVSADPTVDGKSVALLELITEDHELHEERQLEHDEQVALEGQGGDQP